jgi:histidine triad (HIT) family protein
VCPFCEIVANRAPAKVHEATAEHWVIEPLNPVTPGHALIIPTRHVPDAAADMVTTEHTFGVAAAWAARRGLPFNLITSGGLAATQSVFHLHVHYIPRDINDGLHLPWTGQHRR